MKTHQHSHTVDKPHNCQFENCGKKFARLSHLKIHMRIHTGEKPYVCEYQDCKKGFAHLHHLRNHIRTHTGVSRKLFLGKHHF